LGRAGLKMIRIETIRKLALAFEEGEEQPHFEKPSFRIKKKIFATVDVKLNRACLKLSEIDQSVFSAFDKTIIYPVPNKWGKQGWTFVELKKIKREMFVDALTCAYCEVAPKKLAEKYKII
jgi:YjbR